METIAAIFGLIITVVAWLIGAIWGFFTMPWEATMAAWHLGHVFSAIIQVFGAIGLLGAFGE